MVPRLIVHAGFHKTGTTSIQRTLDANRDVLAPHLRVMLRNDMLPLCAAARRWSVTRDPVDLGLVQYEAAMTLEEWDGVTTLLLSSEDLSGHMPGRQGLTRYDAAPGLAAAMVDAWRQAAPGAEITLVYTTRAAGPWLASCHAQHLRATRITLSAADYARDYASSADLDEVVAAVAEAAAVPVTVLPLEAAAADPLGPAGPMLALCDVPKAVRARMTPLPPANTAAPQAKREAQLALNRSDLEGEDYHAARKRLNARRFSW